MTLIPPLFYTKNILGNDRDLRIFTWERQDVYPKCESTIRLSNNAPYRPDVEDSTRPASTTTNLYHTLGSKKGQQQKKKRRYTKQSGEMFEVNRNNKKSTNRLIQEARSLDHNTKSSQNINKVQPLTRITPLQIKPVRNCNRNSTDFFHGRRHRIRDGVKFLLASRTGITDADIPQSQSCRDRQ